TVWQLAVLLFELAQTVLAVMAWIGIDDKQLIRPNGDIGVWPFRPPVRHRLLVRTGIIAAFGSPGMFARMFAGGAFMAGTSLGGRCMHGNDGPALRSIPLCPFEKRSGK